jgi:hypothetical protein
LDPSPEHWEGKRGACVGVFQRIVAGQQNKWVTVVFHVDLVSQFGITSIANYAHLQDHLLILQARSLCTFSLGMNLRFLVPWTDLLSFPQ